MNMQGVLLWALRGAGDFMQLVIPVLVLAIALLWCRTGDKPVCYLAVLGAVIGLIGRGTQWLLPSISWQLLSNIEHIPSGNTTLIEAIAYLAFPNIGLGLFIVAVLIHFLKQNVKGGRGSLG